MSLHISPPIKVSRNRKTTPCLLEYANNSRNSGRFNDVTIQSADTSIRANCMVLSCYCSYFDQMFSKRNKEQAMVGSILPLNEVNGKSLKILIQFIYTGQISIDSENVLDILSAADQIGMNEVKNFCFEFLGDCIRPDNCITILITAKQNNNFTLRDKAYRIISDNYQTVSQTPEFLTLANLELFLLIYHLTTRFYINDEVLCRSLLSWAKHDERRRKKYLRRLIKCVNVDQIDHDLNKDLLQERLIQENPDFMKKLTKRLESLRNNPTPDKSQQGITNFQINSRTNAFHSEPTKILLVGSWSARTSVKVIYSISDVTNEVYPDLPISPCSHCSLILNNIAYCIGGYGKNPSNKVFRLILYHTDLKWESIVSMHECRYDFGAAVFKDVIVVCGGNNGSKILSSTEYYQHEWNRWNQTSSLNQARSGNQSATSGGCLYTMGGYDGKQYLSTVERLDELNSSWKLVSLMQTSRCWFAAVECDDVIYAIGGWNGDGNVLKSVEKYDYASDKWVYVKEMQIERRKHFACVVQGNIFVVGGENKEYKAVNEIEYYDPATDKWTIVEKVDDELLNPCLVVL